MHKRLLCTGLLAVGLLAGCGAQGKYDIEVRNAHEALKADLPELAEQRLAKADRIAAKNELTPSAEARLLKAEARLRQGDPGEARELAEMVAVEHVPGTHERGLAEEVLAKVAIRQGRFGAAGRHLDQARRSYSDQADQARVADLRKLVRGLEAYGQGKTGAARRHWHSIDDPELKASVLASLAAN